MRTIAKVTKYETEDGMTFDTMDDAMTHDDVLSLERAIHDEFGMALCTTPAFDLAKWLFSQYELTPLDQLPAQD